MTQLVERVAQDGARLRVDRDAGVVYGVRVLGLVSANGRRYLPEAVKRALPLYERVGVNADHPARPGEPVSVSRRMGWLEQNRVVDDGGIRGDLHLLKSHNMTPVLLEAAEVNPGLFGLSHNSRGSVRRVNGVDLVESIDEVISVDLVLNPATTKGLHESVADVVPATAENLAVWLHQGDNHRPTQGGRSTMTGRGTIRGLVEWLKRAGRTFSASCLREAALAAGAMDAPAPMGNSGSYLGAAKEGFKAAWVALWDANIDDEGKLRQAKQLLAALRKFEVAADAEKDRDDKPTYDAEEGRRHQGGNLRERIEVPADAAALGAWLHS